MSVGKPTHTKQMSTAEISFAFSVLKSLLCAMTSHILALFTPLMQAENHAMRPLFFKCL